MQIEQHWFQDDGVIPNSPLPVLLYRGVPGAIDPNRCERLFADHGWAGAWRNGIYPFHHFHSIAHEALGIVRGTARVHLGGPAGAIVELRQGDVVVLPAGTGHRNAGQSVDLLVIGAYPEGMAWDLRRGDDPALRAGAEHEAVRANIARVPRPGSDPVAGAAGPLLERW